MKTLASIYAAICAAAALQTASAEPALALLREP